MIIVKTFEKKGIPDPVFIGSGFRNGKGIIPDRSLIGVKPVGNVTDAKKMQKSG
jgi:hypothetical protein